MKYPVLFALLTALFWGMYGPSLGQAKAAAHSPFKPFVAIAFAYLVWGAVGGLGGMAWKGESFSLAGFAGPGGIWGFVAGTFGAWGALTLTLAFVRGGSAHIVMPIVFGGAVTISALVSVAMTRQASPMLWVGIVGMAVCIVIVASNTPHAAPHKPKSEPAAATTDTTPAATEG